MAEGSFTANQRLRNQGSEVPSCSSFPTNAGHAEELATLTDPPAHLIKHSKQCTVDSSHHKPKFLLA